MSTVSGLPAGVTPVTNIKGDDGERGPTGTLAYATAESVAAGDPVEVQMVGPEDDRGAHFKIPRGLPGVNAVENDAAVSTYITVPESDTRKQLNVALLAENAVAFKGKKLWVCTDSFGTTAPYSLKPYPTRIAETSAMTRTDNAAGGSFFRDIAMRSLASPPAIGKQDTVLIAAGINPARHRGVNPAEMTAELDAMETLIWRACAGVIVGTDDFTWSGTWTRYTAAPHAPKMTSGYGRSGASGALKGSYFAPIPARYVGIGYSSVGFNFHAGEWARGGTVVAADVSTDVAATSNATSVLVPRPARIGNLRSGEEITVSHRGGAQFTMVDGLYALREDTPLIVVVEPGYVVAGSPNEMSATPGNINSWRSAINRRIADMRKFHPTLRVVVVSPIENGWNENLMTGADGLHPNEAGIAFLHRVTTLAAAEAARSLTASAFTPVGVQAFKATDTAITGGASWQTWAVDSSHRNDWNGLSAGGVLVDATGTYAIDLQIRLSAVATAPVEIAVFIGAAAIMQTVIDPGASTGRISETVRLAAGLVSARILSSANVTVKGGGAAGWSRLSLTRLA